jgi:hypothetical protein
LARDFWTIAKKPFQWKSLRLLNYDWIVAASKLFARFNLSHKVTKSDVLKMSQLPFPKFTWYDQDKKSDVAGDTGQT